MRATICPSLLFMDPATSISDLNIKSDVVNSHISEIDTQEIELVFSSNLLDEIMAGFPYSFLIEQTHNRRNEYQEWCVILASLANRTMLENAEEVTNNSPCPMISNEVIQNYLCTFLEDVKNVSLECKGKHLFGIGAHKNYCKYLTDSCACFLLVMEPNSEEWVTVKYPWKRFIHEKLPADRMKIDGYLFFEPPDNWYNDLSIVKSCNNNFIDRNKNEWRHDDKENHWDVYLTHDNTKYYRVRYSGEIIDTKTRR